MDFTDAIAIIVACPFFLSVTNCIVGTVNVVVALPFVSINEAIFLRKVFHMLAQGLPVGVFHDPQTDFARLAANGADNGGTVIVIGAMALLFIGSSAWWVGWVKMGFAFFPPHFGTSRRFRFPHRPPVGIWAVEDMPWLGADGG